MPLFSPTCAKHRLLISFYCSCLGLSLVPTVVAPPERSFEQGQPEMQQAMDNMLIRERVIKKRMEFPSLGDVEGYPELLTFKTSQLLSEAEHMLNRVKNVRERRWVEEFVHRLKMLKQSVSIRRTYKNETIQANAQPLHAIPGAGNIAIPSMRDLNEPAVPDSRPKEEGNKITSKYPVTIPQLNRVLPVPAERQVVTKPALTLPIADKKSDIEAEQDDLVRELEELPKIAASEHLRPTVTAPKLEPKEVEEKKPVESSSLIPPKRMAPINSVIENEKTRIKEHLVQEVAALHRLGETEENIMDALSYENPNDPQSVLMKQPNIERGISKAVPESFPLSDEKADQRAEALNADKAIISPSDPNIWRPMAAVHPATQPKPSYMNNSFEGMHINLPPMNQQVLTRQFQNGVLKNPPHPPPLPIQQEGIKDTIQRLQRQHQNFLIKNHLLEVPQALPNMKHNMFVPGHARQGHFFPPNSKYLGDPSVGMYRPDHGSKHIYTPYPYFQNSDPKNLTLQGMEKPFPNHPIGTNLSDEMKRQLRDGKVILLSDNVIRSNFEPESEKKGKDSPIQATIPEKN